MRLIVDKNGFTLVTSLILITFVSISVLSTTIFLIQRMAQTVVLLENEQAFYHGRAGVQDVLYDFRSTVSPGPGYFSLGQVNIDANNYFVIGGTDADLLMVNTTQTYMGGGFTPQECNAFWQACKAECSDEKNTCMDDCRDVYDECRADSEAQQEACLDGCSNNNCRKACRSAHGERMADCVDARGDCYEQCGDDYDYCRDACEAERDACLGMDGEQIFDLSIRNVTDSQSITIDRMIVTWNNSEVLEGIGIDSTQVWSGSQSSPANVDITNFTLAVSPATYPIDYLAFGGDMSGTTVTAGFVMLDGTTKTVTVFPASDQHNFTVKASGKVSGTNIFRTIEAEYNAILEQVVNYQEFDTEIAP